MTYTYCRKYLVIKFSTMEINVGRLTLAQRFFQFLIFPMDLLILTFAVISLIDFHKFKVSESRSLLHANIVYILIGHQDFVWLVDLLSHLSGLESPRPQRTHLPPEVVPPALHDLPGSRHDPPRPRHATY